VNTPPPKPEVILTNFFAEPTVLLVPITSRVADIHYYVAFPLVDILFITKEPLLIPKVSRNAYLSGKVS
jgi:hypothetical protein